MQWHQLDHMQTICTSLQTDKHTSTSSLDFYRSDAPQQCPSTEGTQSQQTMNYTTSRYLLLVGTQQQTLRRIPRGNSTEYHDNRVNTHRKFHHNPRSPRVSVESHGAPRKLHGCSTEIPRQISLRGGPCWTDRQKHRP